jgi:hypothetical protein
VSTSQPQAKGARFEVDTAQMLAPGNACTAVEISRRRMTASVRLIKAASADWQVSDVPSANAVPAGSQTEPAK